MISTPGGFFLPCEDFGRMFDHSFPARTVCFFSGEGGVETIAHSNFTLYARISPQWLNELKRLWPNVP